MVFLNLVLFSTFQHSKLLDKSNFWYRILYAYNSFSDWKRFRGFWETHAKSSKSCIRTVGLKHKFAFFAHISNFLRAVKILERLVTWNNTFHRCIHIQYNMEPPPHPTPDTIIRYNTCSRRSKASFSSSNLFCRSRSILPVLAASSSFKSRKVSSSSSSRSNPSSRRFWRRSSRSFSRSK